MDAACATLVEKADPERFRAIMSAPVATRPVLFALYAFNVEIIRAPWLTNEPMIAEMRLQWWRDALAEIGDGGIVRRHEVVDVLATVIDAQAATVLDGVVAARRWDIYTDEFEDEAAFDTYIDQTSGALMQVAARLLGPADPAVVGDFAYGAGVANLLRALPVLRDRGRAPLPDPSLAGISALARRALARLDRARAGRLGISGSAGAALLIGHAARPVLRRAIGAPQAALKGGLELSPLRQSARLAHCALRGWWV
jgi:15-cis-phytoene synthase